jgi:hypothetical protein
MSSQATSDPSPALQPTIHEATRIRGGVRRGNQITEAEAVQRRKNGLDVVVCGDDTSSNCLLAMRIERQATGGQEKHEGYHEGAGLNALPHWQPRSRSPAGHSFYETHDPMRKTLAPV